MDLKSKIISSAFALTLAVSSFAFAADNGSAPSSEEKVTLQFRIQGSNLGANRFVFNDLSQSYECAESSTNLSVESVPRHSFSKVLEGILTSSNSNSNLEPSKNVALKRDGEAAFLVINHPSEVQIPVQLISPSTWEDYSAGKSIDIELTDEAKTSLFSTIQPSLEQANTILSSMLEEFAEELSATISPLHSMSLEDFLLLPARYKLSKSELVNSFSTTDPQKYTLLEFSVQLGKDECAKLEADCIEALEDHADWEHKESEREAKRREETISALYQYLDFLPQWESDFSAEDRSADPKLKQALELSSQLREKLNQEECDIDNAMRAMSYIASCAQLKSVQMVVDYADTLSLFSFLPQATRQNYFSTALQMKGLAENLLGVLKVSRCSSLIGRDCQGFLLGSETRRSNAAERLSEIDEEIARLDDAIEKLTLVNRQLESFLQVRGSGANLSSGSEADESVAEASI